MAHKNSAASEYESTMENIKKQKEMIKNLKKQPRKLNFFQKIWAFIQEKVFHSQQYTREQYMGANIIDMNKQPARANVETQDQTDGKKEAQVAKEEIVTIPEHKSILFAARDDTARENAISQITNNEKTYVHFKDTGYLARVEKVQHELQYKPGVKAMTDGYRMTVFDSKGIMVGKIPTDSTKRPMNLQELKSQLDNKGYVKVVTSSKFQQLLDDKELSIANIDKSVKAVMDKIKNPYIETVRYANIDIAHDSKGQIKFTEHVKTARHGNFTITSDPQNQADAHKYLVDKISNQIILDLENGIKAPKIKYQISMDNMIMDIQQTIEQQGKPDWTKNQVYQNPDKSFIDDLAFGFEPSDSPDNPGKFRLEVYRDGGKWEKITDPAEIQAELNAWAAKNENNINELANIHNNVTLTKTQNRNNQKRAKLDKQFESTLTTSTIIKTRNVKKDQERDD